MRPASRRLVETGGEMRQIRSAGLVVLALVGIAAFAVTSGSASTPSGPKLTAVPTANTKSDGFAPGDT